MSHEDLVTLYITSHAYQRARERLYLYRNTFKLLVESTTDQWVGYTADEMLSLGAGNLSDWSCVPPYDKHCLFDRPDGLFYYLPWTKIQGLCFVVALNTEDEDCDTDADEGALCLLSVWPFLYSKVRNTWERRYDKISRKLRKQVERAHRRSQMYCPDVSNSVLARKEILREIREEQVTSLKWRARDIVRELAQR